MSNVIPLRPNYTIPEHKLRELVNDLTDISRKYHDYGCLREVISKCVKDALKGAEDGDSERGGSVT